MTRRTEGRFRSVEIHIAIIIVICLVLLDIARASERRPSESSESEALRIGNLKNSTESTISTRNSSFRDESANVSRIATNGDSKVDRPSRGLDNGTPVQTKDSYLEALEHSHNSKDPREGVVRTEIIDRREYTQGPVYVPRQHRYRQTEYSSGGPYSKDSALNSVSKKADNYSFGPSKTSVDYKDYSKLNNGYGSYEPPRLSYGQPSPTIRDPTDGHSHYSYGEYPASSYFSPEPQQAYGPAPRPGSYPGSYPGSGPGPDSGHLGLGVSHEYGSLLPQTSGIPRIDLSWPFALKLNAFTLAKILLKLVIFKMIVKFIAVICLLLFIPKLEIVKKVGGSNNGSADDNDEEGRRLRIDQGNYSTSDSLNMLTDLVTNSVKKYHDLNAARSRSSKRCQSVECHLGEIFAFNDTWRDYRRLFGNYVLEETES